MFMYGLRAKESRRQYPRRLKVFMDFCSLNGSLDNQAKELSIRARGSTAWIQNMLIKFVEFQKERVTRGDIMESTIRNYYKAAKLFCEMNDIVLNWKKITKGLPRGREVATDRAPSLAEVKKLIDYPDRRIKAIVYTMTSSGIRVGAFDYLKWKHIIPMYNKDGKILASKIIVYAGDNEEYYSFITPEAYWSLKDWMDFRASYGENITRESWLMRDLWQTTNTDSKHRNGLGAYPKKLKGSGIKRIIERALWDQGLRRPLDVGQKRHEWKAAHGFRKFYKTRAEQAMNPINVEITMGHNIGVSGSYYRPTEHEVLQDYCKAVDLLTINNTELKLEKEVKELSKKSKDDEYIIKGKLREKDEQISALSSRVETMQTQLHNLISTFNLLNQSNKQELAEKLIQNRVLVTSQSV